MGSNDMTRLDDLLFDSEDEDEAILEVLSIDEIKTLLVSEKPESQTEGIRHLRHIVDGMESSVDDRVEAIVTLQKHAPDVCYECIRIAESGFQISQTEIHQRLLEGLAKNGRVDAQIRLNCTLTLLNCAIALKSEIKKKKNDTFLIDRQTEMFENCYGYLHNIAQDDSLPILIRIDCCKHLFKCQHKPLRSEYRPFAVECLSELLNDTRWTSEYRYELLVGVARDSRQNYKGLVDRVQIAFFNNHENGVRQRILSGSYLLQHVPTVTEESQNKIIDELVAIAEDTEQEFNVRGDAADALIICSIATGIARAQEVGQRVITALGITSKSDTIYDNKQNVHDSTIGKHVRDILNTLTKDKLPKDLTYEMVYTDVSNAILKLDSEHEREMATLALQRINIDLTKFENDMTLRDILMRVWTRVMRHKDSDTMVQNFLTELVDMSETCTTGHEKRLVNILTTMGEATIHISFRDQIIANVKGRMLKRIKDLRDEDKKGLILIGMACDDEFSDDRRNFTKFVLDNVLQLRTELEKEFVLDEQHVHADQFDEYFGDGIRAFQSFVGSL